jgi:hypothetical protein
MAVHFTPPSMKVESADTQKRNGYQSAPHSAKTPRGQRRALKKK